MHSVSHVKERVKKRDEQNRKKIIPDSTAKKDSKDKTPEQIRKAFQERTGKSHPQEGNFNIPGLKEVQEAWSRDFYLKNRS